VVHVTPSLLMFFFTSFGGSDRAKQCRIPLAHAATTFRKQTFTHTVTYNAGKRKFYNFHVWHLPQGSAFKPTHYVCLTAVRGWTISTELWLYSTYYTHLYTVFCKHFPPTENLSAVVGMRKTISIRWSGVMLRGILTVGLTKIWFPRTVYVFRMTNYG